MEVECENRLTKLEESTKSAHHRIDKMEETQSEIHQLAMSVNSLAISVEQSQKNQEAMAARLTEIELKPSRRWDQVTMVLIGSIVAAVAGYLLGKIL